MPDQFQVPAWKVLLIDDDEDDFLLTRDLLQEARGKEIDLLWASSPEAGLAMLEEQLLDVALVDYQLGEENGLSVIRDAIRRGAKIPFILLTGYGSYQIDLEALHAGATDFLVKSEITAPLLERTIRYAIGHKKTEEALRSIQEDLEKRVQLRTQALQRSNEELRAEIAERLRAETALRERESQLQYQAMLLESVNDAIVATDPNFITTGWNRTAEAIYGWTAEEVMGKYLDNFLHTELSEEYRLIMQDEFDKTGNFSGQAIQNTRDGRRIFVDFRATALRDSNGEITGFVSINRDITEKVQIQNELSELQRRLIDSLERERLQLAQELHDGPMQELYGVAFQAQTLRATSRDQEISEGLAAMGRKLQEVNQVLRSIAGELRPPALAPFGLEKAIRSHAGSFLEAYPSLNIILDLQPDQRQLSEALRLTLYRIYQHALSNVARHAKAQQVIIRLRINEEVVSLEVEDDGCGFDVPRRWIKFARQGHMGLVGAVERAEAAGGKLEVISSPGKGTLLRVEAPLHGIPEVEAAPRPV